jgi:hypothetical protein
LQWEEAEIIDCARNNGGKKLALHCTKSLSHDFVQNFLIIKIYEVQNGVEILQVIGEGVRWGCQRLNDSRVDLLNLGQIRFSNECMNRKITNYGSLTLNTMVTSL